MNPAPEKPASENAASENTAPNSSHLSETEKMRALAHLAGHLAAHTGSPELTPADVNAMLNLAGTAAHTIMRPAAPVATFAVGALLAADPTLTVAAAAAKIADALAEYEPESQAE